MTLEEIHQGYALNDGQVKHFKLDFPTDTTGLQSSSIATITLNVRKHIVKQQYEPCTIALEFAHTTEVDICEDFCTQGGYTDLVLTRLDGGQFYLSVDPYGNSGQPNDNDNFVIKAGQLSFIDEKGVKYLLA